LALGEHEGKGARQGDGQTDQPGVRLEDAENPRRAETIICVHGVHQCGLFLVVLGYFGAVEDSAT
jgi:hypothetical protein